MNCLSAASAFSRRFLVSAVAGANGNLVVRQLLPSDVTLRHTDVPLFTDRTFLLKLAERLEIHMCCRIVVFAMFAVGSVFCQAIECAAQGYTFIPTSGDCGCQGWGSCRPDNRFEPLPVYGCGAGGCGNAQDFQSMAYPLPRVMPRSAPQFRLNQSPYYQGQGSAPRDFALPESGSGALTPPIRQREPSGLTTPRIPEGMEGISELPATDQTAALQQRICPVTQELLGSMGKPIRVNLNGRTVFVCCEGCVQAVQRNPSRYLQSSLRQRSLTVHAY